MALDEPQDVDDVFNINGFKYLINKDLMEKAKPIKVDYLSVGFKIDSELDFGSAGCGGCAATSSCSP